MNKFTLRADESPWPRFGDYAVVEQKRYGVPNEMFYHKVVGTLLSNAWVDVPIQSPATLTRHETSERIAIVICCGIDEGSTYRVRVADLHKVEVADFGGWRTIDSAPRDGTEIILRKGNRVTAGAWTEWSETQQHFHQSTGVYLGEDVIESGANWCSWDGGFCEDDEPTHWQPLPAPPAE